MALQATFVRHRERRDRIYVTRQDGTAIFWDFPTYGDRLPHDLVHLVVESELGIANGFWGLVDQGVQVSLIDNQSTLVRHGRPLVEQPGIDLSDLVRAENAVAHLGSTGPAEEGAGGASPTMVAKARQRLDDLGRQWRDLADGTAITLTFGHHDEQPGPASRVG
jgi:hypothetical protein